MSYVMPVTLEAPARDRLKALANARKQEITGMVKEAIDEYIDREERKEQFKQEALTTWQHYQETGLHLTQEEMNGWMDKIKNGEDAELPKCHV